jgi:hypothetical protein
MGSATRPLLPGTPYLRLYLNTRFPCRKSAGSWAPSLRCSYERPDGLRGLPCAVWRLTRRQHARDLD